MSQDIEECKAVYFIQKPFTSKTEQMGCYYFNILQAVELCKIWGAAIVPPMLPLAPRDNYKVELDHTQPWEDSILEYGSINSSEVFDYSKVKTISFNDFCRESDLNVYSNSNNLDISGVQFTKNTKSKYFILNMPPRWGTQKNNEMTFYKIIYSTFPFRNDICKQNIPEWYLNISDTPFLGVHWRRGDRGNLSLGSIGKSLWYATEPDKVAMVINTYIEEHSGLSWVYISTNSGSIDDKELIIRLVKVPVYFLKVPEGVEALDRWKWDVTDLFMCAKAKHIILSPGNLTTSSAFGRIILAESMRQNIDRTQYSFMPFIEY
ncbi:hypothetical protein EBV26_10750 [bacterium]|nr:hypothetical protein [bacterium]